MADDLTAVLAEVRELIAERERIIERMRAAPLPISIFNAVQDKLADVWLPRLLAAVDAALGHHERIPLYGDASTPESPGACPHDPGENWDCHFEDVEDPGRWLCEGKPEGAVCSSCVDGEGGERLEWPCDEYAGILAALTGRTVADVLVALKGKEAAGADPE